MPQLPQDQLLRLMTGRKGQSPLINNYFRWCSEQANIQFHVPMFFTLRPNGMRAAYLYDGCVIPRGQPIFTVPYSAVVTPATIASFPWAAANVTPDAIAPHVTDEEIAPLAPQLYLGLQFAHMIYRLNGDAEVGSIAGPTCATGAASAMPGEAQQTGLAPWCHFIDDENFDEAFILKMFRNGLDTMQTQSYNELASMFNHSMTNIQDRLRLPFSVEHLKRITRVVLSRCELIPTADELQTRNFVRLLRRAWWRLSGQSVEGMKASRRQLSVVPLLDALNHSNRPNVGVRYGVSSFLDNKPAVTVFALTDIFGGQELCRHYNFAMNRAAALFRYGFLPFDVMTVVEHDAWQSHYKEGLRPNMGDESAAQRRDKAQVAEEVARLESVFVAARRGKLK